MSEERPNEGPEIVTVDTPLSNQQGDESVETEERQGPSKVKFFGVVLFVLLAVSSLSWRAYEALVQTPGADLVKSDAPKGDQQSQGEPEPITEPAKPGARGTDYPIGSMAVLGDSEEDKPKEEQVASQERRQLAEALQGLSTEISSLNTMLAKVVDRQSKVIEFLAASEHKADKEMFVLKGIDADLSGLITSTEVIATTVARQQESVNTFSKTMEAERELQQKPTFRVDSVSVWGQHKSIVVETEGFYRDVEVGGKPVQGWQLDSINLDMGKSVWIKDGERYVLSIN